MLPFHYDFLLAEHDLYPPVLRLTIDSFIIRDRLSRTEAFYFDTICSKSFAHQVILHRVRSLFRKLLVRLLVTYVIGMTVNTHFQAFCNYRASEDLVKLAV